MRLEDLETNDNIELEEKKTDAPAEDDQLWDEIAKDLLDSISSDEENAEDDEDDFLTSLEEDMDSEGEIGQLEQDLMLALEDDDNDAISKAENVQADDRTEFSQTTDDPQKFPLDFIIKDDQVADEDTYDSYFSRADAFDDEEEEDEPKVIHRILFGVGIIVCIAVVAFLGRTILTTLNSHKSTEASKEDMEQATAFSTVSEIVEEETSSDLTVGDASADASAVDDAAAGDAATEDVAVVSADSEEVATLASSLEQLSVGDTFEFGAIDTNGILEDGDEPISWKILDKQGNAILVTTTSIIEGRSFAAADTNVKWENSSVREWLNGDFYSKCFTDTEKALIQNTHISTNVNPTYNTESGNDTDDCVFILSYAEAEQYFKTDAERICDATDHTKNLTIQYDETNHSTWWWLRTAGKDEGYMMFVKSDGTISDEGGVSAGGGIRPAMWITTQSEASADIEGTEP